MVKCQQDVHQVSSISCKPLLQEKCSCEGIPLPKLTPAFQLQREKEQKHKLHPISPPEKRERQQEEPKFFTLFIFSVLNLLKAIGPVGMWWLRYWEAGQVNNTPALCGRHAPVGEMWTPPTRKTPPPS